MSRLWSRPLSRFIPALVAFSTIPLLVLTGCGAATTFSTPVTSVPFTGKVFGGQKPIYMSKISVWQVGTTGYGSASVPATALATATTAIDGSFSIDATYACTDGEQVYITASGGQSATGIANPNIMLAVGLGDCAAAQTESVEINEVTTAATAFALAQFFTPTLGSSSTDSFGTDLGDITAFTNSNQFTIPMLVNVASGTVNPNTSLITIESAKIYSIANTLAACVNDASGTTLEADTFDLCNTLFAATTPPANGSTTPTDTLQAAVQMALYPYQNVTALFELGPKPGPFLGLGPTPSDWTIGVSYTTTDYALSITGTATTATSASIDIDGDGHIWFPTNLAGSTGIASFNPTDTSFNGPYLTSLFTQPQYVAIDSYGFVWMTDQSSTTLGFVDTADPTDVFQGSTDVSPTLPAVSLGPIAADADEPDVLFAYVDTSHTSQLGITGAGSPIVASSANLTFTYTPTALVVADFQLVAATSGSNGSSTNCALELSYPLFEAAIAQTTTLCQSGGVAFGQAGTSAVSAATSLNQLCVEVDQSGVPCVDAADVVNLPEGIATDGDGNLWIANSGNASVYNGGPIAESATPSPIPYLHDTSNGSTLTTPYAIAIDGSGNIWIANASCVTTSGTACTPGPFVLSEIIGAAAPTITPLSSQMLDAGVWVGTRPQAANETLVSAHPHPASKGYPQTQTSPWPHAAHTQQ